MSNSVRPIDGSPPGSPVPGILQARTLEWVAISFSNAWKWKVKVKLLSRVQPSATPWTAAYQAPPSIGFSSQEYWSGVPLPSLMFPFRGIDCGDFPRDPMVKNLPCNAGDMGSIPGQGTKIPHTVEQLSLSVTTTEPESRNYWSPCALEPMQQLLTLHSQLESLWAATKGPAWSNEDPKCGS